MRPVGLVLVLAVLPLGCADTPEALRNQCRANMNTLSSDMAMFRVTTGSWTDDTGSLDSSAGRSVPLVCPECGAPYAISLHEQGYVLSCPGANHGSIDTGRQDWSR